MSDTGMTTFKMLTKTWVGLIEVIILIPKYAFYLSFLLQFIYILYTLLSFYYF